jgi:hypothetical protein
LPLIKPFIMNSFLKNALFQFSKYKALADSSIQPLNQKQLHWKASDSSNSVASLMSHLSGNMLSRWKDTLTTDGEKPDRIRELEFLCPSNVPKERLLVHWEKGWSCLFEALASFEEEDLNRTVYIRSEPHTLLEAILRQMTHYSYHVGQIVYLSKFQLGNEWKSEWSPTYRQVSHGNLEINTRNGKL